jgi:hypothetical protein
MCLNTTGAVGLRAISSNEQEVQSYNNWHQEENNRSRTMDMLLEVKEQ